MRLLTAREIECRVQQIKPNGLSLLLYKDARCDMAILDEEFGPDRWQRKHELIDGRLYCSVGIKYDGEWVWKQDVGTESNTEKEKGQASDSFKRACFNVGIGRELYTAPFIWIPSNKCEIKEQNGRNYCNTRFEVSEVGYNDHREISSLVIIDSKNGNVVYSYGRTKQADSKNKPESDYEQIMSPVLCFECGNPITDVVKNGDVVATAAEVVGGSKIKFGKPHCISCWNRKKAEGNGKT